MTHEDVGKYAGRPDNHDREYRDAMLGHIHVVKRDQPRPIEWSEAQDPTNWNPRYHPGYAEVIDDMAAHRRKKSAAVIDTLIAINVPNRTAFEISTRINTSLTTMQDRGLQIHLIMEAMKEGRRP